MEFLCTFSFMSHYTFFCVKSRACTHPSLAVGAAVMVVMQRLASCEEHCSTANTYLLLAAMIFSRFKLCRSAFHDALRKAEERH